MADNQKIREEVQSLTTQLETGIQDLYNSDKYAAYLNTLAKFHNYSTRNTLLIHLQMPEATNVAGFNKWKNDFQRNVMKGEKGIRILAPAPYIVKKEMEKIDPDTQVPLLDQEGKPIVEEVDVTIPMFRPVSVFDVSQTDGQPLPSLAENLTGDVRQYEAFLDSLKDVSVMPISFDDLDAETDGTCDFGTRAITIRNGMSEVQTIAAVVHEMTHAELHDFTKQEEEKEPTADLEAADDTDIEAQPQTRRSREIEAESVSYVVCQHYGIETGDNSFGYIAEWSKGRELAELRASLDVIRKASTSMIERIDNRFSEICKERGIELITEQEPAMTQEPIPVPAVSEPEAPVPTQQPTRRFYITTRQREQAERMAEKWTARSEAFYSDNEGWGTDTAGFCKTPEEAEQALETSIGIRTSIEALANGNGTWADVQVIRQAVSDRDALDAQASVNQDEQQEAVDIEKEPIEPNAPSVSTSRYTALQTKGFDIAKRYEKLPLQDRLNIIAETFGYKSARIQTSLCTGKWRGTSDVSIVFENGSSIFMGNYRTPEAKTMKVQSTGVNNILAQYNPEIVAEIKEKIMPALREREAKDNKIAAEKGLKPYTLLNVELHDGKDNPTGGYMGWYYVTVAIDGKVHALIETGLNYDIAKGELMQSRQDYFVAGALKDHEADFVFNNVGHSSTSHLYKLPLSENVRERAEKTLAERTAAEKTVADELLQEAHETYNEDEVIPNPELMPDSAIGFSERDLYGYTYQEMYPLLEDRALELYDQNHPVYLLYQDNTESLAFDREEIKNHDGIFGIEADSWERTQEYESLKASLMDASTSKDAAAVDNEDTYAIYQLKDSEDLRYHRFASVNQLTAEQLTIDKSNYDLVYSAPMLPTDTLDGIYEKFNTNHPKDFTGHSLSVSDVVVTQQDGEPTAHYVDNFGFMPLPAFLQGETQQEKSSQDATISTLQPTVAELEAQVKDGKAISLLDLAHAVKREQHEENRSINKQKPSVLAQIQATKTMPSKEQNVPKSVPKRNAEMEV